MKNNCERIKEIIIAVAKIENTSYQTELKDIGITSSNILIILNKLENEFDIEFDNEDLNTENFNSIESINSLIERMHSER